MNEHPQTALTTGLTAVAVQSKPFYMSKTLWVNCLAAAATIIAYAKDLSFVKQYSEHIAFATFAINVVLRLVTNSGLMLNPQTTQTVTVDPETTVEVTKP